MFHHSECEPGYAIIFLLEYDKYVSCLFVGGLLRKVTLQLESIIWLMFLKFI